jgi:hypothetical protein
MTDLLTSVRCQVCGQTAAVGWRWAEDPPSLRAVQHVCPTGCRLTPEQLADRFPEMHDRRPS